MERFLLISFCFYTDQSTACRLQDETSLRGPRYLHCQIEFLSTFPLSYLAVIYVCERGRKVVGKIYSVLAEEIGCYSNYTQKLVCLELGTTDNNCVFLRAFAAVCFMAKLILPQVSILVRIVFLYVKTNTIQLQSYARILATDLLSIQRYTTIMLRDQKQVQISNLHADGGYENQLALSQTVSCGSEVHTWLQ